MAKETKKTMDVSKPGESEPDTSARPVIVSHRPIVQDPMVKEEKKSDDAEASEPTKSEPVTHTSKVIQPITEEPEKQPAKEEVEAENTNEQTTNETPEISESAAIDAVVDQADLGKKKKNGELSPEEKAKQESLKKLIAEKKYFVPIGKATRRRQNRNALLLFTAFLVLLAGGYFAIDAGFIQTDITLPVDLIKTKG